MHVAPGHEHGGDEQGSVDQLQEPAEVVTKIVLQLSWNIPVEPPPNAKTTTAIRAAMPAMRRPYSTADAPDSRRLLLQRRLEPRLRTGEARSQSPIAFMA